MKIDDLFDDDYIKISELRYRCIFIVFFLLIITFALFFFIKKDHLLVGDIVSIEGNSLIIFVAKDFINDIKEKKTISINEIDINYNIDKIEEKDDLYLVYITTDVEISNIKELKYKLKLEEETYFNYMFRIIKGV